MGGVTTYRRLGSARVPPASPLGHFVKREGSRLAPVDRPTARYGRFCKVHILLSPPPTDLHSQESERERVPTGTGGESSREGVCRLRFVARIAAALGSVLALLLAGGAPFRT